MAKKEKYYTEEQKEIYSFIKILSILIIIFIGLYLFPTLVVDKKEKMNRTNKEGTVQYSSISVGMILNRADEEYYVLVFDSDDINTSYLVNKAASYRSNLKALPVYTADLSLEFNKPFIAEESFYKPDSVSDIKFKGITLIKVSNGKIVKFIEDKNLIDNELS